MTIRSIRFSEAFSRTHYDRWKTKTDFDDNMTEEPQDNEIEGLEHLLAQKDADIERLRQQCESIRKLYGNLPDRFDELDGEYAEAKVLLARAADALERIGWSSKFPWEDWKQLIKELREKLAKRENSLT